MTQVKICGITSEADAHLCVGLGADALGFVLAPSPRQVTSSFVESIARRVPHEILTVGVFRDEAPKRVVEIANHAGLGAVQLHGHENDEDVAYVAARVACTIKAYSAGDPGIARFTGLGARFILIDGKSPGSGEIFDWRLAEGVVDPSRMWVSGGLSAANVTQAIAHLHPYGVDVSSGVESAPGRKDPEQVRDFVATVRAYDRATTERSFGSEGGGTRAAAFPGRPGTGDAPGVDGDDPLPYDWMDE